ncbi:zinc ribbon domain-containing protein, partial [Streptomyces sp. NPDC002596]
MPRVHRVQPLDRHREFGHVHAGPCPEPLDDFAAHRSALIVADRWYPSSKACSRCGAVETKLPLSMRVFECDNCGLVLDRDANAGHNLVALAARTTGTGAAGDLDLAKAKSKLRGAGRKTRVTRPRRKAGTGRAGGAVPGPRAG